MDRRARLKSIIRKNRWLSVVAQWIFDPAFTPRGDVKRWVNNRPGIILNLGSGSCNFGARVINLDVEPSANVQVVNHSSSLPFKNASFDGVLLEYVLEHVDQCQSMLRESERILRPGGEILATIPFKQNYHACPHDYWRFTHEGLQQILTDAGFSNVNVRVYGGSTAAWIDSTKEFLALIFSLGIPLLYDIFSQLFIIPFIPLRYLDVILRHCPLARYTAFSFLVTAQKQGQSQSVEKFDLKQLILIPPLYQLTMKENVCWIEKERVK